MATTTLLLVVGGVVALKTSLFVAFVLRRGRRQRRELEAVTATTATPAHGPAPSGWRLQWAEPGVLLVQNVSPDASARQVDLSATLTSSAAQVESTHQQVRFVGTGACFEVRFAGLEGWFAGLATEGAAGSVEEREQARRQLSSTFSYSLAWLDPGDERCEEARTAHVVVPVPDLALEAA